MEGFMTMITLQSEKHMVFSGVDRDFFDGEEVDLGDALLVAVSGPVLLGVTVALLDVDINALWLGVIDAVSVGVLVIQ